MKLESKKYNLFADLFEYPGSSYAKIIEDVHQYLVENKAVIAAVYSPFSEYMLQSNMRHQQELFIRSFDVQAVTTLDLGYVLFGDDYKRGELLVNLNREHNDVGNDCGTELSDYLANVLRLLPKMKDHVLAKELALRIVLPALRRMVRGFEPEQIVLKEKFYKKRHKTIIERPEKHYTIYVQALQALVLILEEDFGIVKETLERKSSDFLKSITTEVELESPN